VQRLGKVLERLALGVLLVGGAGMLTAMFLGAGDVVGTQFLGSPVPGAKEITESTMVLIVFGALAYAQIRSKHIRVELVYTHMGARVRAGMDVLADMAALTFFGLLLWQAIGEAMLSSRIGEAAHGLLRFPLYPARWIIVVGTVLLLAQLVLDLLRNVRRFGASEADEAPAAASVIPENPGLQNDNE